MSKPTQPPPWFTTEIRNSLATLYALSLEGCPAADVVTATANLWVNDLWASRREDWHESDVQRIREAFAKLRGNCRRWPQMADFWAYLPQREQSPYRALPGRVFTDAERRENLRRLREMGMAVVDGSKKHA